MKLIDIRTDFLSTCLHFSRVYNFAATFGIETYGYKSLKRAITLSTSPDLSFILFLRLGTCHRRAHQRVQRLPCEAICLKIVLSFCAQQLSI